MTQWLRGIFKDKELDKAELNDGEKYCEGCGGIGILKENDTATFCPKCKGTGKLDWVEEIVGKQNKNPSALENVNVRQLVNYVQKELDEVTKEMIFTPNTNDNQNIIKYEMSGVLSDLVNRKALESYNILIKPSGEINIFITPTKSMNSINLNIKLT